MVPTTQCPSCRAWLKLPDPLPAESLACPQCGADVSLHRPVDEVATMSKNHVSAPARSNDTPLPFAIPSRRRPVVDGRLIVGVFIATMIVAFVVLLFAFHR
jgi:hypothetical protein